ncbi:MAG: YdeI/OmpD-associated family protein [Polyangiaceae bacterium]
MAAAATRKKFTAKLESIGPGGSWTRMEIPFDAAAAFGSRARVAVWGTLNGFPFRTSILPNGDGTHHMMLNKALLAGAKASAGERVTVVMEKDIGSREVATPSDLAAALGKSREAKKVWSAKTPTFRAEYVAWVEEAKSAGTRARRVSTTVEKVAHGLRRYD